jgi:ABC-2 type transport system ATP-binding protein
VSTTVPADQGSTALAARSLTRRFGSRIALQAISFELRTGELVAIIGPNGAGKTTLLSILAGVLEPTEGEVVRTATEVGWVPQQPALYSKLSAAENLRLFARLEGVDDPELAVTRMLGQTGLTERADEQVDRLSGGNQQRLNIAVGLLPEPPALLLDEPSASLDPRQRERLWEFIGGLTARGTAVVFATHNVAEVARYADRVLVLVDGELLFTGTPAALERTVAGHGPDDFEHAFVRFLHDQGH